MAIRPTIAIVGPGNLGRALARSLRGAGYRIREVITQDNRSSQKRARDIAMGARVATASTARLDAEVVWFCVPDREIAQAARTLGSQANWEGKIALHSSGALASDELEPLRRKGASVASLHPLMTFVSGSQPRLAGVPFGVEGDTKAVRVARRIVHDLKGDMFRLPKQNKVAYHAWGAFTSPLLLSALVAAEEVAGLAGISRTAARKRMLPIVAQTLANYAALGPERAFSGPIIRGDVDTVARHLKALGKSPGVKQVYLALARAALRNLPVGNRKALERILKN
ncbi:MAG TPA: Rossmann-like and DUF2520 domain-containing protein [Terriglobales bacterium]|nr:Rossmann-like and DUF2520 domain-containing protein [Terriglobales bacterium]